ncbi:MAG TPA: hypothetical protein VI341_10090 [Actinomycetota bacterium]
MHHHSEPEHGSLPRREFLRRSSLGAVALAALGTGIHTSRAASVLAQLAGDPEHAMDPHSSAHPLAQPVAAIGVLGRRVVAVGGVRGDARVWSRSDLGRPWAQVAGPEAFPDGTALTGLGIDHGRAVVVGCTGPDHQVRPVVFSSSDLRTWGGESGIGSFPGVLTGVAFSGGRGLAVGARFAEADVEEPIETVAYRRGLAGRWVRTSVPGVRPVQHGAVTLRAGVADRLVLGLTDVHGLSLYSAPGVEGPWRSMGAPKVGMPLSPVAAASVGGSTLLAGVDARDQARFWRHVGRSWIEIDPPTGVGSSVKVRSLRRSGSELLVAGSRGHGGYLREVKVS